MQSTRKEPRRRRELICSLLIVLQLILSWLTWTYFLQNTVSRDQHPPFPSLLDYQERFQLYCDETLHGCSGNGRCLLERCICNPGWRGSLCQHRTEKVPEECPPFQCSNTTVRNAKENQKKFLVHCNSASDTCHFHPDYGVIRVSDERWKLAQVLQLQIDINNLEIENQKRLIDEAFLNYQSLLTHLPSRNLGNVLEIASGPYTQLKTILQSLPSDFTLKSVTLLEPNLMEYKTRAPGCSYKDGTLLGHRVNFLVGRGEDFLFSEVYDLVIMINGIEHCQDGISVLHNLYHAIKPGGYLIWHERSFDEYEGLPYSYSTDFIDFLLHPLRLKTSFFEWFLLDHFESLYYNVTEIPELSSLKNLTSKEIYFIGRKPMIDLGARYLQQRLPSSRRSPDL